MLATSPWRIWPLHVTFFTELAFKNWNLINKAIGPAGFPLPHAFTFTVELEGVDARSSLLGTGRTSPIEVTDGQLCDLY